jgi:hypothetical protein
LKFVILKVILWQDKLTAFAELQQENSPLKRRNDLLLETQAGIIVSRFLDFNPFWEISASNALCWSKINSPKF